MILLQILDEGRLTDSKGRSVDFKKYYYYYENNIGSQVLLENVKETREITESTEKSCYDKFKCIFQTRNFDSYG